MAITAAQVNELRKKTGAGMMDCKKALTEADGDFEKAIEILRKKGASVAVKRAEKVANEGIVLTKVSDDKTKGTIVEINCETDFVAKSEDFVKFANETLDGIYSTNPSSVEDLLEKNPSVKTALSEVMGKVGEKINITRFAIENASNGLIVDYVHPGAKLGVLVKFDNADTVKDELSVLGKDLAMQVAAMNPLYIHRDEVSQETINKEIEIYKEVSRKEKKPEQMLEKIANGKLKKFFQENCFLEQSFIKDNTKTVKDLIEDLNSKHRTDIKIVLFHRFHLGDEKK